MTNSRTRREGRKQGEVARIHIINKYYLGNQPICLNFIGIAADLVDPLSSSCHQLSHSLPLLINIFILFYLEGKGEAGIDTAPRHYFDTKEIYVYE